MTGCVNRQSENQSLVASPPPSSPFDLSLNRELHYQQKDTIDTSLFGLKQAFVAQEGDFNRTQKPSNSPAINGIISRGVSLLGTPYRYGGQSVKTGFDCSGLVGYLYQKEAGVDLPRSTSQLIKVDAPRVAKTKLKPGDVLFFATGRGRQVSHTGIYIGNDNFIHSANERKGVRIDSLNNNYWNVSFVEAKRILN
ncbi:C40 family peptidase [Entomomonas asaccharolytica]|uniref:C40 family peptidase n=2 Tax=Entomomonas asaccharolytica TaxID=2785331 RepID=A0A974NIE3_9GAMM|nr:C40 family peptidase [Entomomonas asaccharolytica]